MRLCACVCIYKCACVCTDREKPVLATRYIVELILVVVVYLLSVLTELFQVSRAPSARPVFPESMVLLLVLLITNCLIPILHRCHITTTSVPMIILLPTVLRQQSPFQCFLT